MLALVVVAVSCSTARTVLLPSSETSNFTDKEKEIRSVAYRDSILKILLAKESKSNAIVLVDSTRQTPAGLLNSKTSHLTTEHAISDAWVEDGVLRHNLFTTNEEFSQRVPNAIKENSVDRFRFIYSKSTIKIAVTTNVLTSSQIWWIRIGKIAAAIIVGLIVAIASYFILRSRR